jgi:hypothetical protein
MRIAETPLLEDLRKVNIKATSVWDLVNTKASYAAAIPVLLRHFEQGNYLPEIREGIARALAVQEASYAWDTLLRLFRREPEGGPRNVKWALACALAGAATDEHVGVLIDLAKDKSLGENRLALLSAIAKSKTERAAAAFEELRSDPQLAREIRILLGRPKRRS